MAWASIVEDNRLPAADDQGAGDRRGGQGQDTWRWRVAGRCGPHGAMCFYPMQAATTPGKPFDLEHILISARERAAIPVSSTRRPRRTGSPWRSWAGNGCGWRSSRSGPTIGPHLPVAEIAEWFGTYVYLPKLRDRVVLDGAIRDAVAKLDPQFGYADAVDAAAGRYRNLVWGRNPPEFLAEGAVVVRAAEALEQLADDVPKPRSALPPGLDTPPPFRPGGDTPPALPAQHRKPRRFYGSVELDLVRPVKNVEAIVNAVVAELQRTRGATVTLTLEIAAEAPDGFDEGDVGVVRDNTKQLKFRAEATGFSE